MISRLSYSMSLIKALYYNQSKVEQHQGSVLMVNKIIEPVDGIYNISLFYQSFLPYLWANNKTEKPVFHVSLNPHPGDKISDEDLKNIAKKYMEEMGYASQPYVVFKHTDIERHHLHIVSIGVDIFGKKISNLYCYRRSMEICRKLEEIFGLRPPAKKNKESKDMAFKPVNYKKTDLKNQISSVLRYLPELYLYGNLSEFNDLLYLFNLKAEEVKKNPELTLAPHYIYFVINPEGKNVSHPFTSTTLGEYASYSFIQQHFELSTEKMKAHPKKAYLKHHVEKAYGTTDYEADFKEYFLSLGINTLIKRNKEGSITGVSFIDHNSKVVWTLERLDLEPVLDLLNSKWEKKSRKIKKGLLQNEGKNAPEPYTVKQTKRPHKLFDFLYNDSKSIFNGENPQSKVIKDILNLFPLQGEIDLSELDFVNQLRKKRKKRISH
ncbi:conjugal transfer protein MobB [Elizabethkingia ursingii]|uniref:MobA/VirD2-like nuclease domain-containing protein n=2 Tax=Elizabethkingia ursingii TaxID=1756150 RepID=A0AAJ3TML5_9FLAO|nr:conjugal transfer protein MobB [Elizabethkingia ursingii]AQX10262.1 hypothetical protein BBD34_17195 [Elizabethkingia ursingii]OPB72390.1 hypothetical protein BAY32_12595 [Elizabethkingia ursingii]